MCRAFIHIILGICTIIPINGYFGPKYPPTSGSVWPKPANEIKDTKVYEFNSKDFKYEIKETTCKLLEQAIERCKQNIHSIEGIVKLSNTADTTTLQPNASTSDNESLQELQIVLNNPCEDYPYLDMEESYNLTVSSISELHSESIWGIIRGLETFSQLFYLSEDYKKVLIKGTKILDYPQYTHRGLLLDTGRHYLSMKIILDMLDAMAMNKMNVFHWHIVDDQSFPYQSERFPELSAMGSYHSSLVYTKADIHNIVEFARQRGIRVIPEIDVPGHCDSWGASHSEIVLKCSGYAALNPIKNETYDLLRDLLKEAQEWFPDKYFHMGGDEVGTSCWKEDKEIQEYMKEHNLNTNGLLKMFFDRTLSLYKTGSVPVIWEDPFGILSQPRELLNQSANFKERYLSVLPKNVPIQIWKWGWVKNMRNVLKAGYPVIFSAYWYLDYKFSEHNFDDYYKGDPRLMVADVLNKTTLQNILGGEACMWGEMVDNSNVFSRTWPRASAVAEVLWSYTDGTVPDIVFNRMEEQTCRMIRRGLNAEPPSGPGFCITMDNMVHEGAAPPSPLRRKISALYSDIASKTFSWQLKKSYSALQLAIFYHLLFSNIV